MKILRMLIVLATSLWACAPAPEPATSLAQVESLERQLLRMGAGAPPDSIRMTVDQLLAASEDFVRTSPRDTAAARVLFRAANVAHGDGRFSRAMGLWARVVEEYPGYAQAPDARFLQGFTADKDLQDAPLAISHYEAFLQQFPNHQLSHDVALLLQMLRNEQRPEDLIRSFSPPPDTTEAGVE